MKTMISNLFESALREKILLYLQECGDGYSRELSQNFGASLTAAQNQLRNMEDGGILVSRTVGRTRVYRINPRYFLRQELEALLRKMLDFLPEQEIARYYRPRKRPRRPGKPL